MASAIGFDLLVLFHVVSARSTPDDWYAQRRFGLICNQIYVYTRTTAGVTPPWPEQLITTWYRPVWESHPMAPNMAGYSVWSVPFTLLVLLVGWPAFLAVGAQLPGKVLTWWYAEPKGRRGFEPIINPGSGERESVQQPIASR